MRKLIGLILFLSIVSARAEDSPMTKKVKLSWAEVEKSQAYELEVYRGEALVVKETIISLSWESRLEAGSYKYRVRALDEFSRYGNWTAFEEFEIKIAGVLPVADSKSKRSLAKSSLSFAVATGVFDYGSEIGGVGYGRVSGASDACVKASAEYWFTKYLSLRADASYTTTKFNEADVDYPEFGGRVKYAVVRNSSFHIAPLLSLDYQNTPELYSSSSPPFNLQGNLVRTISIGAGAEASLRFMDSWAADAFLIYQWPINYSGPSVQNGMADSSTFYKYGFGISYYFKPKWSLGLEYNYEYRKVSYETGIGRNNLYKDTNQIGLNIKAIFGETN